MKTRDLKAHPLDPISSKGPSDKQWEDLLKRTGNNPEKAKSLWEWWLEHDEAGVYDIHKE